MDLVWLEDLVELAAARNFSVAAQARGITQPAFSRRIRALEHWVGAQLIDRSTYPVKLTVAGENVLEVGRPMIQNAHRVRDECRQMTLPENGTLSFSVLHSIALKLCPDFLKHMEKTVGPFRTRIEALDYYETIDALSSGRCDLAFCYSHPWGPPVLTAGHFRTLTLGRDPLVLAAPPEAIEAIEKHLALGAGKLNMPLVAYTPDCFLGKMQEVLARRLQGTGISLQTVFECSMSEVIKRMILSGSGVGWLPKSVIERELKTQRLAILSTAQSQAELDIILFRSQSPGNSTVERLWNAATKSAMLQHN
ncbi:LysR substrate-binding domain-containing protein [Shimia sp. NS0008-38b]|uniref:LysR family transcriptional regulator n=1 Tax=Shimia sp. NS0008-38b TaxID=3127653 RepID=UPI003107A12D